MSIAGGLAQALVRGRAVGCSVVQLFLKNQLQWVGRPLAEDEVAEFRRQQAATGIRTVVAHAAYLINLASPDRAEWQRSVDALGDELERAERLGLPLVVVHPGSHKGAGREPGLARVAEAVDVLHGRSAGYGVRIVLENTAGSGNLLGARLEDLREVLDAVRDPDRLAFCLDTCHLFAAGYDIRGTRGMATILGRFGRAVGFNRIAAFHLNDARAPLGSGLDRHEHIGRGRIGLEAFRYLVSHPGLANCPMAIETPKDGDRDARNLATLRRLRRCGAPAPTCAAREPGRRRRP
jgi:deoxyribonuclease-4